MGPTTRQTGFSCGMEYIGCRKKDALKNIEKSEDFFFEPKIFFLEKNFFFQNFGNRSEMM